MKVRCATALFVLIVAVLPASAAVSVNEVNVNAGLLVIGTADPLATAASPVVQSIGASLPIGIVEPLFLEPMVEFFGSYYLWTPGGNTVPADSVSGTGFFTIGTMVSLHVGVGFPVSPVITLGGSLGLDFLFRFPFEFQNVQASNVADQNAALGYFFAQGRFFYPETRFFLRWQVTDPVALTFNLRAFYPLFHLWDGLGQSFLEQFMFEAGLGFGIRLGTAPAT